MFDISGKISALARCCIVDYNGNVNIKYKCNVSLM